MFACSVVRERALGQLARLTLLLRAGVGWQEDGIRTRADRGSILEAAVAHFKMLRERADEGALVGVRFWEGFW